MNEPSADEYITIESNKIYMGKEGDGKESIVIPSGRKVPCVQRAHKPARETAFSKEAISEFIILSALQ